MPRWPAGSLDVCHVFFLSFVIGDRLSVPLILWHHLKSMFMKTMKIGVIGAGGIGRAFAQAAAAAGYEVMISNSRGPETLAAFAAGIPGVTATDRLTAATADIILLSVQWQFLEAATAGLPDLSGKIVLDALNPVIIPEFIIPDLGGKTSSELVAAKVPGAAVVKIFNTLPPALVQAPQSAQGGKRVVFFSGDDQAAKERVGQLVDRIGFAGVDLGGLVQGGVMQHFPGGPLAGLHLVQVPEQA